MRTIKVTIVSILLAAAAVCFAHAQSVPYTLDATETAALTAVVARMNVERAAQDPPQAAITVGQYVTILFRAKLAEIIRQEQIAEIREIVTRIEAVDSKTRDEIKAVLVEAEKPKEGSEIREP